MQRVPSAPAPPLMGPRPGLGPRGRFQCRLVLGRSAPSRAGCESPFTPSPARLLRDSGQAAARPPHPETGRALSSLFQKQPPQPAGTFQGLAGRQRKPVCWHSSARGLGGGTWRGEGRGGTLRVGRSIKAFPTWSVSWTGWRRAGGAACTFQTLHRPGGPSARPGLPTASLIPLSSPSAPPQLGQAWGPGRGKGAEVGSEFSTLGTTDGPPLPAAPSPPQPKAGPGEKVPAPSPACCPVAPSSEWPSSARSASHLCQDVVGCPCAPPRPGARELVVPAPQRCPVSQDKGPLSRILGRGGTGVFSLEGLSPTGERIPAARLLSLASGLPTFGVLGFLHTRS